MAQDEAKPIGPDLSQGISLDQLADGKMLVGHVGGEDVLLVRRGQDIFAVGAHCAHYHGPLVDGLVVGDTVRCPWHHACFDLRTGEALAAPALSPIACWPVEQRDGKIWVSEEGEPHPKPRSKIAGSAPEKIVIIGGGAAGFAAAEMLRREHYQGSIAMLSSDDALPYDRPNLSKDYLAGSAPFDYVPLRQESFILKTTSKRAWDKRFSTSTFAPMKSL
jgi:apoptosis-inducing factor 3